MFRRGELVDRTLIRELTKLYQTLDLYACEFEPQLLVATGAFYESEGKRRIESEQDIDAYLLQCHKLIRTILFRMDAYIFQATNSAESMRTCCHRVRRRRCNCCTITCLPRTSQSFWTDTLRPCFRAMSSRNGNGWCSACTGSTPWKPSDAPLDSPSKY